MSGQVKSGELNTGSLTLFPPGKYTSNVTSDPTSNGSAVPEQISAASERQSSTWDIRNAPRNYISLVVFQAGSAFFSFASVWLITRYLGAQGYGGIVAVIAASQVAQVLINWTSMSAIPRRLFRVRSWVSMGGGDGSVD